MIAGKTDIVQEVEATGKVRPAQERDLSFQRGGAVAAVYAAVGDKVEADGKIVSLDTSELQAQLRQANASVLQEEHVLDGLKKGTRPEDIARSQTAVANAERSLSDANSAYQNSSSKAVTDLASAYDGAVSSAQSAVVAGKNALVDVSAIQYSRFIQQGISSETFSDKKSIAIEDLFSVKNAGNWTAETISKLSSGIYGDIQGTSRPTQEILDRELASSLNALSAISDALDALPVLPSFSSAENSSLSADKSAVSSAYAALSAKVQLIDVQKATNNNVLASAKASVTTAENALAAAKDDLALKQAGNTKESLDAEQARVAAMKAQQDLIQTQINTMTLRSPIAGVVTKQDARVGVFTQAGVPVVSVISSGTYEVEVYIPEVDIAKVAVGDAVSITLDAYTDQDIFKATVVSIDPAETILEGVATYKVTVAFENGNDPRILPGMTANTTIRANEKKDVIAVPTRAIITDGDQKKVRVLKDGKMHEVAVTTGLKSSDGRTEIVSGISSGEEVITFIQQ